MDAKPTQHTETTHPDNLNLKRSQRRYHSPTLFNIYTADLPPPRAPVHAMSYADTITSTHNSRNAANNYIQPYIHTRFSWTKDNNLTLNPDKTTYTLFTPEPAEYKINLDLKINNNTALPMATHPTVLDLTLDPNLTYRTHIHNISVQAHTPLQIIICYMATYKVVMRPTQEYASSIWSPFVSLTSINKLQVMQNAELRTATGCTRDTNIQHNA